MICQRSVYKIYWRFDRLKNVKISNNSVSVKKFSGKFQKILYIDRIDLLIVVFSICIELPV